MKLSSSVFDRPNLNFLTAGKIFLLWQDIFIVFGILTLLGGVFLGWVLPAKRKKAQQIQEINQPEE